MTPKSASTSVNLRPARGADLGAVLALLEAHHLPTDGVAAPLDGFLVAESARGIVGVIGLETYGAYGLLRSAAVSESERSHGVGRKLVERLLVDAASRRLAAVYLLTTTAERYFPRFGFAPTTREAVPEPVRQSVEFTAACPASAIVMMRPLSG